MMLVRRYSNDILKGLQYLHANGIVHRDLKTTNVLVDGHGLAKLADFGCAKILGDLHDCNTFTGTPAYMAPEQLRDGQTSVASDIYSLGAILYEMFTGQRVRPQVPMNELRPEADDTDIPSSPSDMVSSKPSFLSPPSML